MDFHLSFIEAVQLITAVSALGAFLVSACNSWRIQIIHRATNSMKDALVAETKKASFAEGKEAERGSINRNEAS
jgi:hypothetical protein